MAIYQGETLLATAGIAGGDTPLVIDGGNAAGVGLVEPSVESSETESTTP